MMIIVIMFLLSILYICLIFAKPLLIRAYSLYDYVSYDILSSNSQLSQSHMLWKKKKH